MFPTPLHPFVVHAPIVLGVLLPIVAIGALVAIRSGIALRPAWAVVVTLSAALALSAFVAVRSGQEDEEIVEEVVSGRVLHEHEEAGERYLWLSGAVLALAALGLAPGMLGRGSRYATVAGGVLLVAAAVNVGHLGGQLVYEYGAAAPHVERAQAERAATGEVEDAPGHDEEHEDEEHEDDD